MARSARLVATTSFAYPLDGKEHFVHRGEVLPASHPAVKGRRELFAPELPLEQATAAPGERRNR